MSSRSHVRTPSPSFASLASLARLASTLLPVALLGTGCLPGLSVVPLQSAAAKPANVAVYFSVETNDGKPVANLTADQFTIFEDGARLDRAASKQVLVAPKGAVDRFTLLLFDMSGSALATKEAAEVVKAAAALTDKMDKSSSVAAYTYDGSADLNLVMPFGTEAGSEPIRPSRGKGKSSLDDAVIGGLKVLARVMTADAKAVKLGTLVLLTETTDHATLSPELRAAFAAPENSKVDVFAIGLGSGVDSGRLGDLGKSGTVSVADPGDLAKGFEGVSDKMATAAGRYYLLSYCTPARSGPHEVRIEAHSRDGLMGDLTSRFSADGFGAGCDPSTPPSFDVGRVVEAPAADKKKDAAPKKPAPPPPPAKKPAAPAADPFAP
jgi:hypothetical protein